MTDGLADAMWPAWDASGKYLWFLASTDFGLQSQWLDMTSYDHDENFGLYFAVLKKGEPSPLLPESDEDHGVGSARSGRRRRRPRRPFRRRRAGGRPRRNRPRQRRRASRWPCRSISTASQQRILAVPGVPERQYSELRAGVAGTVFYLEAAAGRAGAAGTAAAAAAARSSATG